jgi:hypothetical protein
MKYYIDNFVHLRSYIINVNKHFWSHCRRGSQYLISVYRLHRIILASIISLAEIFVALCLFVVFTGKCLIGSESLTIYHSYQGFPLRTIHTIFLSIELLGFLVRQVIKWSTRRNPRMSFKQLADESIAKAWERYLDIISDLSSARMEEWEFTQGFYYGLSQEPRVPTIQCKLGPFKVHYALCDMGASVNIMPKMVYDCLDEDPLILVSWCIELADSTKVHPYGWSKDVLIEIHGS